MTRDPDRGTVSSTGRLEFWVELVLPGLLLAVVGVGLILSFLGVTP